MRCRLYNHVDEGIAIRIAHHLLHLAHRQSPRENQVASRGQNLFARLDPLVCQDPNHLKPPGSISGKDAPDTRCFKNHARAARLVVDHQHLRRAGKTSRTLPTIPSAVITAMSGFKPSFEPLSR